VPPAATRKGPLSVILIELVFDAPPGAYDTVAELARQTTAATCQESGCVLYRFTTDLDHPDRFILTELWESEEHLKAHFAGEAFRSFWARLPQGGSLVRNTAWEGPLATYTPPSPVR
jgi:quinol monooxygenase YgiN